MFILDCPVRGWLPHDEHGLAAGIPSVAWAIPIVVRTIAIVVDHFSTVHHAFFGPGVGRGIAESCAIEGEDLGIGEGDHHVDHAWRNPRLFERHQLLRVQAEALSALGEPGLEHPNLEKARSLDDIARRDAAGGGDPCGVRPPWATAQCRGDFCREFGSDGCLTIPRRTHSGIGADRRPLNVEPLALG